MSYNIYRGQDGRVDYGTPVAVMADEAAQVVIHNQNLPAGTIWHYVRKKVMDCCLKESPPSPVCIVQIDDTGQMRGDVPNPVCDLTAAAIAGGVIRLRWRYDGTGHQVAPSEFRIYMGETPESVDFDTPAGKVVDGAYGHLAGGALLGPTDVARPFGIRSYEWDSLPLTHGVMYLFCVRSASVAGAETKNTNTVWAIADAAGPPAITTLGGQWKED